ncbi:MAG: ABC transporter ATP-binding protein [Candidatus Methanomethyliaceae archaeon]|nr:ABC transporter ATP-binding protein [Candidatus Methanomethyliaceae archaeon]MCX8170232.1 ABC transporter ATP-binding protein [Candidatus Methanomethyliaceae archaeon]MDW7970830.1 ABC transporter ATP-binding protein [Nitrososphaerota archaeon]
MAEDEIIIDSISKSFKQGSQTLEVIKEVSFNVSRGEFICIVGPSGCGKTTLLKMICGLEPPTLGRILIRGNPPNPKVHKFGVIFQEDSLMPWRNVMNNIKFGLEIRGMDEIKAKQIAEKYIEIVGLKGFENYYPHQLSGGMKKRVAIARALAIDPDLILMDEPFADLDAQTRSFMQKELFRIWSGLNKTIIFITHNVEEAVFLAQRVIIMTRRPSRVKAIIKIDLPHPRNRLSPPFISYREKILNMFHEEIWG